MKRGAKKPTTANTLAAAHAEAGAWCKALYWSGVRAELMTWRWAIPLIGKILPDELADLRDCCPGAATALEAGAEAAAGMMVDAALEARRIRRQRGVTP